MILDELKQYAHDCISGKNISGRKHIWACERLLKDIDRIGQSDFPYIWNEKQAENIVEWFALLRHSKGILAKAFGAERVRLDDVVFTEIKLADWEAEKLLEESIPFNFSGWEVLESIDV